MKTIPIGLLILLVLTSSCSKVNDPLFEGANGSSSAGILTLVNGTDFDWEKTDQTNETLQTWAFPDRVPTGSSVDVFIDPKSSAYGQLDGFVATVNYRLNSIASSEFQIVANSQFNFILQVNYIELQTKDVPVGSMKALGWNQKGYVSFILSGKPEALYSNHSLGDNWMAANFDLFGAQRLSNLCMIGTHNSGMSIYSKGTAFTGPCNTLTQYFGIKDQLMLGVRYFDIRPVLKDGIYYTGHYSKIDPAGMSSWQGACGQQIEEIIAEINQFCEEHRELIVLNFSHSLNTDLNQSEIRSFNQDEWITLFDLLQDFHNLYINRVDEIDLTKLSLSEFIAEKAAVVLLIDGFSSLGEYQGNGFYRSDQLSTYNEYSNTNQLYDMVDDQFQKMANHSDEDYFLLSWTLTQSNSNATTCFTGTGPSIKDLAISANQRIPSLLYPKIPESGFPNIIYIDYLADTELNALNMALNYLNLQ